MVWDQNQNFLKVKIQGPPYVFATFPVIKTTKAGENIWLTL